MVMAPATILGGLPVIAEVWFTRGDGFMTDDDAGVDGLYWQKRDGNAGKALPDHMWDRLYKANDYWQADVTEQVSDYLAYNEGDQHV